MKTISISTTYYVKGYIDNDHVMTECGKVINVKLGKEIKPKLRGNKAMYWIDSRWQSDFKLNTNRTECPF